jgi:pimeloyl-ACP methyl ester carboxylesterase
VVHRGLRRFPGRTLSGWFAHPTRARLTLPALRRVFRMSGFRGPYPDEALIHTLHGVAAVDLAVHARRLHAVAVPTAVVWCEDDPLIEPEIPAALDALLPAGPRLRFADGGHNPQKHHALEVAEALAAWLSPTG